MATTKSKATKAAAVVATPSSWDKFLVWFATSPLGTAIRVGIGAGFAWVLDNITIFDFPPTVQVGVVAAVSAALRWLNPADTAYGLKTAE